MDNSSQKHAIIVGAGLAGSLQAIYLAKRGFRVDAYEKRDDSRKSNIYAGKSINLALSERGRSAFRKVGLEEEMVAGGIPMYARLIHNVDGSLDRQPYGRPDQYILSIGRQFINEVLCNHAEKLGAKFHFKTAMESYSLRTNTLQVKGEDGRHTVTPDLVVGADGAYSRVRRTFEYNSTMRFELDQQYLDHGYKELCIPPNKQGTWAIASDVLHIWPRGTHMMIALPNLDHSFTVTLFMPHKTFDELGNDEGKIFAYFRKYFPDSLDVMPDLMGEWLRNPTSNLVTISCGPYHYQDKCVILGDAAHAVVPFYGQGMNASLQDVQVLDECMDQFPDNLAAALQEYSRVRKPDADAIRFLSKYNYFEMRDHVNKTSYKVKKNIDSVLNSVLGSSWTPLYTMVAFTTLPYSEAVARWRKQQSIVSGIFKTGIAVAVVGFAAGVAGYLWQRQAKL